jgi:hypothetical protein
MVDNMRFMSSTSSNTTEQPKQKEKSYGGYVFGGVLTLIVSYFYKKRQENKEREALLERYEDARIVVPEEINELRSQNAFMPEDFEQFGADILSKYGRSSEMSPERFFAELFESDEDFKKKCFPAIEKQGYIHGAHVIRRLINYLEQNEEQKLSTLELLAVLSLIVQAGAERRALCFYKMFESSGIDAKERDVLIDLTHAFLKTFQFPAAMIVMEEPQEIKYVTQHHYHMASASEKVDEAIQVWEEESRTDFDSEVDRFMSILLDRPMCLWGTCYTEAGRHRLKIREARKKGKDLVSEDPPSSSTNEK